MKTCHSQQDEEVALLKSTCLTFVSKSCSGHKCHPLCSAYRPQKQSQGRDVDGGNICKECGGSCCHNTNSEYIREAKATIEHLHLCVSPEQQKAVQLSHTSQMCPCYTPQGCVLPREHRPVVCRSYVCLRLRNALGQK